MLCSGYLRVIVVGESIRASSIGVLKMQIDRILDKGVSVRDWDTQTVLR